jgi:hypothetical protein
LESFSSNLKVITYIHLPTTPLRGLLLPAGGELELLTTI